MIFTANQPRSRRAKGAACFAALAFCFALLFSGAWSAQAADQTALTVNLKGISYSGKDWLSVPISGLFHVQTLEGETLGQLRANPSAEQKAAGETDTLIIQDASLEAVILVPAEGGFPAGFVSAGPMEILLAPGNESYFTALAYAKQGLFSVRNTIFGSGEPVQSAEFLLVSADGQIQFNFTTDDKGLYTLEQALPSGEYTLMQMKTAEGTLPLRSAAALTIPTYFGKAEDIPLVLLENQPAPIANGQAAVRVLESKPFAMEGDWQGGGYAASIALTGGPLEPSTLPLTDFTIHLMPTAFINGKGEALEVSNAISMESIRIEGLQDGFAARVQGLSSQGEPVGAAQPLASGDSLSLGNARGAAVTFVNKETGEAVVPAGFQAGTLQASIRYSPTELMFIEHAITHAEMSAWVSYGFEYPNTDGTGMISAKAECEQAPIRLAVPNQKTVIAMKAVCSSGTNALTLSLTEDEGTLPPELSMALALPQGARVDEKALSKEMTLLREKERDEVVFTLEDARKGNLQIPLKGGSVSELSIYLLDPCTLMKTQDNPYGANIEAEAHESHPLLNTLLNLTDGVFARFSCGVEGSLALADIPLAEKPLLTGTMYEDLDRSGTRTADEPVSENQGILLLGDYSGVYYGAVTGAAGEFAIYGLEGGIEPMGTLIAILPDNALSVGSRITGRLESKGIPLPDEAYPIAYNQMGKIHGRMTLDNYHPIAGGEITLWQDKEKLETLKTDEAGAYSFDGLVQGDYQLTAMLPRNMNAMIIDQPGSATVTRTALETGLLSLGHGEEKEQSFEAASLGALEGSIAQGGNPVEGARAELIGKDGKSEQLTTDGTGLFAFSALSGGQYTLTVTLPDMHGVSAVDGKAVELVNPFSAELSIPAGETVTQEISVQATGALSGMIAGVGEGQSVVAVSMTGQVSAAADAEGKFAFEILPAGDYTIYAPLEEGKDLTTDSPWQITQRGDMIWISAMVQEGERMQLPEASFVEMTSIEGVAYVDGNGDFVYSQGEQLMSGVTVALQRRQEGKWMDVGTTQTNDYGAYAFRELRTGAYRVVSKVGIEGMYVAAVGPVPIPIGEDGVMCSEEIRLQEGTILSGETDIALVAPSSVRFSVFSDSNENGLRGEYERPIAGARVEVLKGDTVIAFGAADATGEGQIFDVPPGEMVLRVTLPDGYQFTQKGAGQGIGVSCVEDQDSEVALSDPLFLESEKVLEVGVAAVPVGSFSGRVWNDLNNDGIMNEDEPGLAGVTLTLAGKKSKGEHTLVTDDTGQFRFPRLRNDSYTFSAALQEGTLFARYSQTGGDLRSVFTTAGSSAARSFVVSSAEDVTNKNVGVIEASGIEGVAFFDLNYNGIFDEDEPGYPGVKVEVSKITTGDVMGTEVTDADGAYSFPGLRGGEYRVRAILPEDGSSFSIVPQGATDGANLFAGREGKRENTISPVTIGNGGRAEALIGIARGAEIKGTVFFDDDYNGMLESKEKRASGIKVELVDSSGAVVQNTTTNANGNYTFQGVMPETYTLRFLRKDKHAFTRLRSVEENGSWVAELAGNYGVTDAIPVTMGEDVAGINAGILPSATLRGTFFDDLNDNGLLDEGEAGMAGVAVRLYSQDAEIDLMAMVADDGSYSFDGAMPGSYTLTYHLPERTELAKVAAGGNTLQGQGLDIETEAFSIALGAAVERPLAGGVVLGSFEGSFFHDMNANGVQDAGEESLSGLKIVLTPSRSDLEVSKAEIGADGQFSITDLRPADYQLALELPEGYIFSASLAQSGLELDTVNNQKLSCSWQALTNRAENAIGCVKPAEITGYVFLDENRSGTQESDESLMSNLAFELVDEATGRMVKRASSGSDGHVTFADVRPGVYTLRFTIPDQAYAAGEADATFQNNRGMMVQSGITVQESQRFDQVHAGLVSMTSIGGIVALEENGVRMPLEGIRVRLTLERAGEDSQVVEMVTDENGKYRVDGLWPAECRIEAELPEGMIFVRPVDPNYAAGTSVIAHEEASKGTSDAFSLQMARHLLAQDILYIRPAMVGDIAWVDSNRNGLVDAGEPMLPGVTVSLMDGDMVVAETKTDAFGYYLLAQVYPGTYTLKAEAYPELGITKSVPELRIISSCLVTGDGNSAQSDPFSVLSGTVNMNFDLGFILLDGQSMPDAVVPPPQKDWTGGYISGWK